MYALLLHLLQNVVDKMEITAPDESFCNLKINKKGFWSFLDLTLQAFKTIIYVDALRQNTIGTNLELSLVDWAMMK